MPLPNVQSIHGSKLQPLPSKRELETSRSHLTANEVHDGHVQEFKEKLTAELSVGGIRTLHIDKTPPYGVSIKPPLRHARCHDDINGTLGLNVPFETRQGGEITIGAPQSPASGTSPPSNCKPGLPLGWGQGRCSINLPMTLLTTPSHSAGVAPPLMIPELARTYSELTPASTPFSRSLNRVFSKASSMSFKSNGEGPDKIVTIDCGGIIFRTFARTLQKIPKSRLCKLAEEGSPLMQSGYIFFDRNPVIFAAIMEYYRWIAAVVVPVCLSVNVNVNACDVFTTVLSRIQHVFLLSLSAAYAGHIVYAHTHAYLRALSACVKTDICGNHIAGLNASKNRWELRMKYGKSHT